jgi:hypothetical protein
VKAKRSKDPIDSLNSLDSPDSQDALDSPDSPDSPDSLDTRLQEYRDRKWRRTPELRIETAAQVEQLVEDIGFCYALTDIRTDLPSVYISVCGRRDAHMPRNVQKDPEASLSWVLKDEVMRRGKVYYGKLNKGKAMFVAPRLLPCFNALWGISRTAEKSALSASAQKVLKVLREEWEMATIDLRAETGITSRKFMTRAIDTLQKHFKVIPAEAVYAPKFSYIWTLAEARFPEQLSQKIKRKDALREIARVFLQMQGMTKLGELARTLGLSRKEAGLGNHMLVDEGFAERISNGVYKLKEL